MALLYYIWIHYQQDMPKIDAVFMSIVWLFYFIIMPFIIRLLNKIEFFNAILELETDCAIKARNQNFTKQVIPSL